MFDTILTEIAAIDGLEKDAWSLFSKPNQDPQNIQEALLMIQWCINRRTAAFNSLSSFAQVDVQNRQMARANLSPGR